MAAASSQPLKTLSLVLILTVLFGIGPAAADALPTVISLPLPAPFPPIRLLTLLVGLHLIGLCFGLGGATMLDFWILRWMRWGGLPPEIARTFLFVSKVVSVGIALLWLSGLGFLAVYAVEAPEKLSNPKILAKFVIVLVLTVNGLLIHALVLPSVLRDVSRPMFEGVSHLSTAVFLVSGAVSGVSWYAAFALGLMRELNGRVSAGLLLTLWLAAVAAAAVAAFAFWQSLLARSARGEMAKPSPDLRPLDFSDAPPPPPHPMRAVPMTFTQVPESRIVLLGRR
ncbi:hypothetical protein ASG52_20195 [Methylobacterium sp. Leaf456]|uniref:hypothetical protein n=1 Tax=Methylobacterium sp. Leaf456 TaxID=1736382 RepID=UPI0006F4FCB4|nr:hypothetical protein [Methylobacterium sp. Leaf456]KQT59709.1 hypothetical protein ASG52_20195 [Methylobacterium sp. Leaf456]